MTFAVAYTGMPHAPGWETGAHVIRSLRELGFDALPYGTYYQSNEPIEHSISLQQMSGFDTLIVVDSGVFNDDYNQLADAEVENRVYWLSDIEINPDPYLNYCSQMKFDAIFSTNMKWLPKLREYSPIVHYLPYGIDPSRHRIMNDVEKDIELGFVGSIGGGYTERTEFVEKVKEGGIEITTTSGHSGWDFIKATNRFQNTLNLNVSFGDGLLNARTFEAPACGSLLITNACEELAQSYREEWEVLTYESPEDVVKIMKRLRAHPNLQKNIARVGYEATLERHTYKMRAQEMLFQLSAKELQF